MPTSEYVYLSPSGRALLRLAVKAQMDGAEALRRRRRLTPAEQDRAEHYGELLAHLELDGDPKPDAPSFTYPLTRLTDGDPITPEIRAERRAERERRATCATPYRTPEQMAEALRARALRRSPEDVKLGVVVAPEYLRRT